MRTKIHLIPPQLTKWLSDLQPMPMISICQMDHTTQASTTMNIALQKTKRIENQLVLSYRPSHILTN
jgi:hypothetical protein